MVTVVVTGAANPRTTDTTLTTVFDFTTLLGGGGGAGGGTGAGGGGPGGGARGGARAGQFPTTKGPFWAFTPGVLDPATSGIGVGVDATTTKVPADRPRGTRPKAHRTKSTIIAVAVVVILLFLTVVVIYTMIRHGFVKRYRGGGQWAGRTDATGEAEMEMDKRKKKRAMGRKVNDALVLEDV